MSMSGSRRVGEGLPVLRHGRSNLASWIAILRRPPRNAGVLRLRLRPLPGRIVAGAAITLLVLAAVVFMIDAWAMREARTLPLPLRSFFETVTDFGKSGWILWPIGIGLMLLSLMTTPRIGRMGMLVVTAISVRLTFVFAAVAVPGLFVAIIKRIIGRARPHVNGGADANLYDPFAWDAAHASLPSGHATTAFAAAFAIAALWPQARPFLWIYALLIAVSRVVVFAHYPSDVIAGAVTGLVGAALVCNWFAARRLAFTIGADGRIRRPPSPSWQRIKTLARRLCAA